MGGVRRAIEVGGRECWTLFHTGSRNAYLVPEVAKLLATSRTQRSFRAVIGGVAREAKAGALLCAEVEGHHIATHAFVVDELGADEAGKPIEILFGAIAMRQWGIRPVPDEGRLDLTHYPKEFVEF